MKSIENTADVFISEEEVQKFKARGYNDDLLPKTKEKRNMKTVNYFTLWMGSVHNVPNYLTVGGFLLLGLSPISIMLALIISGLAVSVFMVLNGRAGSKYGIPFALHLRSSYGKTGAKLPGFLRGCVAAIAWFGIQNITGSVALLILLERIWPGFANIGGDTNILGLSVPGLISFTIFTLINVLIGIGGGGVLNKFTAILNPLIYLVFGGMTVWSIYVAGGVSNILSYVPKMEAGTVSQPALIAFLVIINSCIAVWAAPGASASDFTQNAVSTKDQTVGQAASLLVAYGIFAVSSVSILIGSSIYYQTTEWNILEIIKKWDNLPAVALSVIVLLMTTISTNATGNIIPAGYQLSALFPKTIDYKKGVLIASAVSVVLMPWKLIENQDSVFVFLGIIGSMLGPVAGVMLADFFLLKKQNIDLNELYMDTEDNSKVNQYTGINIEAYIATLVGLAVTLCAQFVPALGFLANFSWFIGVAIAFVLYILIKRNKIK